MASKISPPFHPSSRFVSDVEAISGSAESWSDSARLASPCPSSPNPSRSLVMTNLTERLGLPDTLTDEGLSHSLVSLITAATQDPTPRLTLAQIYHAIACSESAHLLDPLSVLPIVLPCFDPAAKDIIKSIAEHGSPREVIIAVQEAVECIEHAFSSAEEDPDEDNTQEYFVHQLGILTTVYSIAIPRIQLRKKTPFEIIGVPIRDLRRTLQLAAVEAGVGDGRDIIRRISLLVRAVVNWARSTRPDDDVGKLKCTELLYDLLDSTIIAYASCIQSSISQQTFYKLFPRFKPRTVQVSTDVETMISEALEAATALEVLPNAIPDSPTLTTIILMAHSPLPLPPGSVLLVSMLPLILTSIQTNVALDETLVLLLLSLTSLTSADSLSPDTIIPLTTVLPTLASVHPDQTTRHIALHIFSILLLHSPPTLHFHVLSALIIPAEVSSTVHPPMRVAAISLLRSAVLSALSQRSASPFASPMLLQTFGSALFIPNPPDLFSAPLKNGEELMRRMELQRLGECLGLIYVLLLRDVHNRTGIRDRGVIQSIEKGLLGPMRTSLAHWEQDSIDNHGSGNESSAALLCVPFVALQVGLERIDGTIEHLMQS